MTSAAVAVHQQMERLELRVGDRLLRDHRERLLVAERPAAIGQNQPTPRDIQATGRRERGRPSRWVRWIAGSRPIGVRWAVPVGAYP